MQYWNMPMIEITTGNSSAFAGYLASIPSYHLGCLYLNITNFNNNTGVLTRNDEWSKTKTEVSQLLEIFDTFRELSNVIKWNLFSFRNGVLRASYLPLKILFDSKSKRIHPEPIKNARWIRVCGKNDKQCEKSCKDPRRNNNSSSMWLNMCLI